MADGPSRRTGASRPARPPPARVAPPTRVSARSVDPSTSAPNPKRKRNTLIGVAPPATGAVPPLAIRPSMPSLAIDAEPTVLVVGDGFAETKALEQALGSHGIYCETASASVAAYTALAVAPDIVLLVGDAAGERHEQVIGQLRGELRERMPPVAIVTGDRDLARRLKAFRQGAVAVFTDANTAEPLAAQVAQLIKDLAKPVGYASASLGEASLDELLAALSKELRDELVEDEEPRSGPVRLVLGGGKPIAIALHEFVGRVKRHVVSATSLPSAPKRESIADALPEAPPRPPGDISGMRMIVADEDAGRADIVAQALRARGATVVATNLSPSQTRLKRLRRLDPTVLLTGDDHILGRGLTLVQAVRDDCRLRWASLLVLRWEEVWPDESDAPAIEPLLGTLAALSDLEHGAEQRAAAGLAFDLRLESIGPVRLLRALCACKKATRINVHNPRMRVELELRAGNVLTARAEPADGSAQLVGVEALAALSVLHSGRVTVEPSIEIESSSMLGTLDELLARMDGERPPVAPSRFPEALGTVLPASLRAPPSLRAPAVPAELVVEPERAAIPPPPTIATVPAPSGELERPSLLLPAHRRAARWLARPLALGKLKAPLWVALACGAGLVGALIAGAMALYPPRSATSPVAAAAPASSTGSIDERGPAQAKSLLDRARDGDESALESLRAVPTDKRSSEQAFALSAGEQAKKQRELSQLMDAIAKDPARLRDRATQKQVLAAARDPLTGADTLRKLAAIEAPESADVIYEAWSGTPGKSPMTELAESLIFSDAVRKRASPALSVALDLRTAESCDAAKRALDRAIKDGDRRSLRPLARLISQRGCGQLKTEDCYPCLRRGDALRKAVGAVRNRRSPL